MAGFGSIAAVGKSVELALVGLGVFSENVPRPHPVPKSARTPPFLVRPTVSLLLYRVDFNKTMRANWSAIGSVDGKAHLPVDLHYLFTAWADNADHEHRLIGRAMQILEELGSLSGPLLHPDGEWLANEAVQLYLEDIPTDDLMRTFESLGCDFRLSIPYIARVIVVSTPTGDALPDVLTHVQGIRPDLGSNGTGAGR